MLGEAMCQIKQDAFVANPILRDTKGAYLDLQNECPFADWRHPSDHVSALPSISTEGPGTCRDLARPPLPR